MKLPILASSRRFKSLAVAFGMVCLAHQAVASTILQWGGDYVTTYQSILGAPTTTSPGNSTWNYSAVTPKSPSSGYTGPKFYGAFSLTTASGTPLFNTGEYSGISHASAGDRFRFSATAAAGTTMRMSGLVFFKQSDFAENASTGTVTLDADSPITLQLASSTGGGRRTVKMAIYARVGTEWGWYLSNKSGSGSSAPFSITDPVAEKWALYSINDTTAPLNPLPSLSEYTTLGSAFTEIGAVGFFFDYLSDPGASATMYLSSFEFNGNVAIPEPSTAMLWLGGAVIAVSFRKFARHH